MGGNAPEAPALIHARVAQLVALAFCARQRQPGPDVVVPAVLSKPVDRMRLFYFERHTVAGLAQLAGMSPTHFARVFKATFGISPIDWLRRERISQAKRRLVETTAAIRKSRNRWVTATAISSARISGSTPASARVSSASASGRSGAVARRKASGVRWEPAGEAVRLVAPDYVATHSRVGSVVTMRWNVADDVRRRNGW